MGSQIIIAVNDETKWRSANSSLQKHQGSGGCTKPGFLNLTLIEKGVGGASNVKLQLFPASQISL